jgi:hypothetical protein
MRHFAHRSHAVVIGSRAGFYLACSQLGRLGGKSPTVPRQPPAAQSDKPREEATLGTSERPRFGVLLRGDFAAAHDYFKA